jgi:hypothetical protein
MDFLQFALVGVGVDDLRNDGHEIHVTGAFYDCFVPVDVATKFFKPPFVLLEHFAYSILFGR